MDRHEMTAADLARAVGCSSATVSYLLNGHSVPHDGTMQKIARCLGEDFDFIMGYTDVGSKGTGKVIGHILAKYTPEELELLRDTPESEIRTKMGEWALSERKRQRKKPGRKFLIGLVILAGSVSTALGTASFEHWHHDVDPILFSPPPSDCFHTAAFNCPCDHRHSMTPPRTAG
jgi:transcriptional regulator with XRE-family HTH domain